MTERPSPSGSAVSGTGLFSLILMSRRVKELSPAMRYLLALAVVLFLGGLRFALLRSPTAPFAAFYVGVALASSLFGLGPGLLALAVSAVLANLLFPGPHHLSLPSGPALVLTLVFVGGAGPIAVLCALFRHSLIESHRIADLLRESRKALVQSEARARESERGLRSVADCMPQIVWAARPDGYLDYFNRQWFDLTGATPGSGGDQSWLPFVHPDDRQRTIDVWYEAIRTGLPPQIEVRLRFAGQGDYRWHLNRALPVRDEQGRITRWYGTCTDMHDWKVAEEGLREAARRKTEFLAMLSHELRNPLAPIRNGIFLLGRVDPGSEQARRALAIIDRQSQHLVRLVDDLLDLTRIERGKIHLETDRLDLRALLAEVAEDHRGLFQNAGVRLEVDLGAEETPVRGDSARLAQAVGNLLQNAAKFTPRGGSATLRLARDRGATAVVTVADTGDGIPPEVMAHLFQPFVQAEKTLHRSLGGLGLGLTLVKGLLDLHGGTIRAESSGAGQGARFTVCLPLDQAAPSEVRPSERLTPDLPPQPRREVGAAVTRPR
jgi:PAS domain S-box-containing protein